MDSVPASFGDVFDLVITLRDIKPTIYRRVRIPAEMTLEALHEVLQVVFGWKNYHLHEFLVGDIRFGTPHVEDQLFLVDECAAPLGAVAYLGATLGYQYDFGDGWEHDIHVARVTDDVDATLVCLDGARACPPEDCGGPGGYMRLLEILANPKHDEYAEMKEWIPRGFNPEKFNLAAVNRKLATLSRRLARSWTRLT